MADHRITDFVDQSAIDRLKELSTEMTAVKDTYVDVAKELLKGIRIKVDGLDDLERMTNTLATQEQRAAQAAETLSRNLAEQNQIIGNTTNTISRQLMEQEKLNEKHRTSYERYNQVHDILGQVMGDYQTYTQRLAQIEIGLAKINEKKKQEKEAYEKGQISQKQYADSLAKLIEQHRQLSVEKSNLSRQMKMMEKEEQVAFTSYDAMSQQLAQMKRAYRELNEEGRNSEIGQNLLAEIKELGAHLKDLDASMGDFQRNVGDYAIACNNGVTNTEDLNRVLGMEAATIEGCIEQNKALEQAKATLDTRDADYAKTLEKINEKMAQNKERILDVDNILQKEATSVAEAKEQNKQLSAAIELVDLKSDGAKDRIAQLNAKIEANNAVIAQATPAVEKYSSAIDGSTTSTSQMATQLLSSIGVNTRFMSAFQNIGKLESSSNIIKNMGVNFAALGRSIAGLLTNPYALALLGVAGVVAGFKAWFSYNKGLVEATRLTKEFTGLSGDAMIDLRSQIAATAKTFDKDYKDVLTTADTLAAQFGITHAEALKAVNDGFLAGGDIHGDMLDKLEKYPAYFKEAGMSANEFTAIVVQTRSGILSDKGLDAIKMATERIRRMPKATAAALDAIGMSSTKIQKGLADGTTSMMDVIKQVSAKLKELPDNSQLVGQTLKEVFGKKGPDAGLAMIRSLADIETNLDKVKEQTGELGEVQEQQLEAQTELETKLATLFDTTGGNFDVMLAKAKLFVTNGLTSIISGVIKVINYFVELYNKSIYVRVCFQNIVFVAKAMWESLKQTFKNAADALKGLGNLVKDVFTGDFDKIGEHFSQLADVWKRSWVNTFNTLKSLGKDWWKEVKSGEMNKLTYTTKELVTTDEKKGPVVIGDSQSGSGSAGKDKAKKTSDEAKKAQKEVEDAQKALTEATIALMKEGLDKEIKQIEKNYDEKIKAVKGNTQTAFAARAKLEEEKQQEITKITEKYEQEREKMNLENKLATVAKGSDEELQLKLKLLAITHAAEVKEAEKNDADLKELALKQAKERAELLEEHANDRAELVEQEYANKEAILDKKHSAEIVRLKNEYAEKLEAAKGNYEEQERLATEYDRLLEKEDEDYAIQKLQNAKKMYEEMLNIEDLSDEEILKIKAELAKTEMELNEAVAESDLNRIKTTEETEKESLERRKQNISKWLNVAAEGLNAINDLASALFDSRIQKVEEEQTAIQDANTAEQEHIAKLVEQNVISTEEGEARKRAAEDQTAKRNEELERKKAQLKYKQAMWDKMNSLAQAGIATALAITEALPNPVMAAIAGAMGAIQIATILATPIPKYAEGTDYHRGGLAIVGDAGEHEVVAVGTKMYITPKVPTIVNMPQGAQVFPSLNDFKAPDGFVVDTTQLPDIPQVVVNNDYKRLERKMDEFIYMIKQQTKQQHRDAYCAEFERLKIKKGL